MKSEKLTNGLEKRKVINSKSDFSLPETSENRKYARKFKNLFDYYNSIFLLAISGILTIVTNFSPKSLASGKEAL